MGNIPVPWSRRKADIFGEQMLCYRQYYKVVGPGSGVILLGNGRAAGTSTLDCYFPLPVPTRVKITNARTVASNIYAIDSAGVDRIVNSFSDAPAQSADNIVYLRAAMATTTFVLGQISTVYTTTGTGSFIAFDARI